MAANWFSEEGSPVPFGQSWVEAEQAYNFSLYSENAARVTLRLFGDDPAIPVYERTLDPMVHKLRSTWFCRVPKRNVPDARYYAYSIDGPAPGGPDVPFAFDPQKVLLDPYARSVYIPPGYDRKAAIGPGPNDGRAPLGMLSEGDPPFDWGDDHPRRLGPSAVIYEMHVRGMTRSPTSGLSPGTRGTFAGLVEKIPHLQELGVTLVELMPIHQFDPQEGNYWGYMTLNFFAPHLPYAADRDHVKDEFRAMVKALHAAGIEVILDVVYNHTAEAGLDGPTYSYKGIDNAAYYILSHDPAAPYQDFSGTGNTLNTSTRAVRSLVLSSLRYWVTEMHVDGFRFDLASVFSRLPDGSVDLGDCSLVTAIRADPVLRDVYLIAEPWDAAGLYQLGSHFPGRTWRQWNGQFRDDVRRFVRGDPGLVPTLMRRLYGSDDLFPDTLRDACRPFSSINYVTSHDGFTLYDQVSYNERRNWANGHGNTDGFTSNNSWNCGWEGDDGVPDEVLALRFRQAKNLVSLLLLANGIPMFLSGDEFLQTQRGNNNPYNQDNETSWLDWSRLATHAAFFRFFRLLIAFRKAHPTLCRSRFWRDDVRWYGVGPIVDMSHESRSLAYALHGESVGDRDLYVMISAYWEPLTFTIQEGGPGPWQRTLDTALASPDDISDPGSEPVVPSASYEVQPRSVVVLIR